MRYTLFGKSGLRVSELALGTMTFGEDWGWGAGKEACAAILDAYLEAGGNFIDTANNYTDGTSETILGELLQDRRDEVVLATKYNSLWRKGDPNAVGNHRKNLVSSLEASLRRLQTDRVDVLWVHAKDTWTPTEETMRALDDQIRLGKVLYVGVSDWPAWEVSAANTLAELRGWTAFTGLQIRYNLLGRSAERELMPMAKVYDLAVTAWGPLAEGLLTGKYLRGETGRQQAFELEMENDADPDLVVREVVRIADEGGWSPAQVAIAWLLSRRGNVIPILGASKPHQLRDNLGSADIALPEEALTRLDTVSKIPLGFPHNMMAGDFILDITVGDKWRDVEDRRSTVRRTPHDQGIW